MKTPLAAALLLIVAIPSSADLGTLTVTPVNTPSAFVPAITIGPDGAIWFISGDLIGRTTVGGTATTFPVPTANPGLSQITTGSDGNIWFVESNANKIGKMTTSGAVTEYPFTGVAFPSAFTAGPDGNLWLFGFVGNKGGIARYSTSGASVGTITLPGNAGQVKLAPGPGNAMWFHDRNDNTVGYVTSGGAVQSFPFKTAETAGGLNAAGGLAQGGDGNMWVAHSASIVRVSPAGVVTEYPVPGGGVIGPVAASPDGNIWFGDHQTSKIGRVLVGTATDQSVTIEQVASSAEGPAQMISFSGSGGTSNRVPLATDPCSAGSTVRFIIRTDPSTPPYVWYGTIQTPAQPCADIAMAIRGADATAFRWMGVALTSIITTVVTNNGPNPAKPVVTESVSGDGQVEAAFMIINDSKTACNATGKVVTCQGTSQLATGESGIVQVTYREGTRNVTVNAVGSSDLVDQAPSNNAVAGLIDLGLGTVTPLTTSDQPVVNVTKRR